MTEPLKGEEKIVLPPATEFNFHDSLILRLCRSYCEEMKHANLHDKPKEMKVYGCRSSLTFKDKNKRTVWYTKDQQFVVEPNEIPSYHLDKSKLDREEQEQEKE